MNNFVIDTPDNFWQIRWLDKYMEGHKGFIAGGCFKNILILEEGLEDWDEDDYRFYGLPLFKATAVKYGWDNPIGEDSGRERKYDSQY